MWIRTTHEIVWVDVIKTHQGLYITKPKINNDILNLYSNISFHV